jgi:hypothetical protein
MGKKPKMPDAPPPAPTPPSFASYFAGKKQGMNSMASLGGTFQTASLQPLLRKQRKKSLLGQ